MDARAPEREGDRVTPTQLANAARYRAAHRDEILARRRASDGYSRHRTVPCPRCGTQHDARNEFCRACREAIARELGYAPERVVAARRGRWGADSAEALFWARVDRSGGLFACWPWTGPTVRGYGRLHGRRATHRVAYELLVGPIAEGLTLDHLCRNKLCANPAHLEPVTLAENIRRAMPFRTRDPQGRLVAA